MRNFLTIFILIAMGFGVMFGVVKPGRIGRFLAGLVFGPLIVSAVVHTSSQMFLQAPLLGQVALVLVAPFALAGAALMMMPATYRHHIVSHGIYDISKWMFFVPFRLIRSAVRRIGTEE